MTGALVRLPDDLARLYVVGQLHGSLQSLRKIDEMIADDVADLPDGEAAVLHAGGHIDKGGEVPELLDVLKARTRVGVASVTYLAGAHERMMLSAVRGERRAAIEWLLSGAEATLDRWGVPTQDWIAKLPTAVPRGQIAFLEGLAGAASAGQTRFVCSTLAAGPSRPFGLLGQPPEAELLTGAGDVIPIGNSTALMRGAAPDPWSIRDVWTAGRVVCVALGRPAGASKMKSDARVRCLADPIQA